MDSRYSLDFYTVELYPILLLEILFIALYSRHAGIASSDLDYKISSAMNWLHSSFEFSKLILKELQRLEPDAAVYKMIGQVLVKQDLEESKQNVEKRIDYISKER